jgi:hypothetical protein
VQARTHCYQWSRSPVYGKGILRLERLAERAWCPYDGKSPVNLDTSRLALIEISSRRSIGRSTGAVTTDCDPWSSRSTEFRGGVYGRGAMSGAERAECEGKHGP